jgi:transcriptional regulator with XRE-family HTH domain
MTSESNGYTVRSNRLRHVAKTLHVASLKTNMTQADICRATGMGRDSMSRYFRGMTLPDALSLQKLSRALNTLPRDIDPGASEVLVAASAETGTGPAFEVRADPDDATRLFLRINQPVPFGLAAKIMVLIEEHQRSAPEA